MKLSLQSNVHIDMGSFTTRNDETETKSLLTSWRRGFARNVESCCIISGSEKSFSFSIIISSVFSFPDCPGMTWTCWSTWTLDGRSYFPTGWRMLNFLKTHHGWTEWKRNGIYAYDSAEKFRFDFLYVLSKLANRILLIYPVNQSNAWRYRSWM